VNLKTFQAETMATALAQVKRELGPDAVILHTRTFHRGGLFGLGRKRVVEITAGTDVRLTPRHRGRREKSRPQGPRGGRPSVGSAADDAGRAGDRLLREIYQRSSAPAADPAGNCCSAAMPPTEEPALADSLPSKAALALEPGPEGSGAPAAPDPAVAAELRQLRQMVHRVVKATDAHARPDLPEPLFEKYLGLLQQELASELAGRVVSEAKASIDEGADEGEVDAAITESLAQLVPSGAMLGAGDAETPADGRPKTVALIGPTGVGKTTTLAKLAAAYKLREKRNVALITIDTYRIAAVEQLRSYADIIGVPLHVAQSPLELKQAMNRCRGCDAVLIDTAGRSQRDDAKLGELRSFLDAADPHEVHLVLASTSTQRVLEEAIERFSAVRTDRIIFTKLDEAVSFGVVVNIIQQVNKQLSFITTGQDVPNDIERGEGSRVAELLMSGELRRER
jgi:flagellar biosynthesis protein FlhF